MNRNCSKIFEVKFLGWKLGLKVQKTHDFLYVSAIDK